VEPSTRVSLSVVAPVFNEAESVNELAQRCVAAALGVTDEFEVLIVDDASTDATAATLEALSADPALASHLRLLRLPTNGGQYAATLAGLRAARGRIVVVLDGDLQDPPEVIPELLGALDACPEAAVAYAVKSSRADPAWVRLGSVLLRVLQRLLAAVDTVPGSGSYCALRSSVVRDVLARPVAHANLAAVVATVAAPHVLVPYAKQARAHGQSRVGPLGLLREAWGSLAVTGALRRLAWAATAVLAIAASAAAAWMASG